jgi:hypothetical protein
MKSNDDETAFPVAIGQTAADSKGMSLRDWFAGMVRNEAGEMVPR